MAAESILKVQDLSTEFTSDDGVVRVLDGVSFTVPKGQTLGLVGVGVGEEWKTRE